MDAGKAVARDLMARFVSVPTIASNDAPTSRAIVLYADEDHHFIVESLGRNPDAVVVDTAVLAAAPKRFLRYGIGDALAKAAEAEGCGESPMGLTPLGSRPAIAGLALARACSDTLHVHGLAALKAAGGGIPDDAFESTVEAVILMSGLGFENGGLSVAHAMTRGLMLTPRTRGYAHGEHVAYGHLVQMAFDGDAVTRDEVLFLAEKAMTAARHVANYHRPLSAEMIAGAIDRLEALS